MSIMDYKQFEGHTPAKQWTTYSMGADNPYHAVRIGGEGFDLPITKGADARLLAAAPELLAENSRYRKALERIAREDYNQNHYEHTEERHIWNMMFNMIQRARMALGQDIETGEVIPNYFEAESFGAEEYFEYHVYVVDDASFGDMYIVDNARDFETKEEAIKAAHEVSKDERGKGKTVYVVAEDRENDYEEVFYEINEEGDVMMAEEFESEFSKGEMLNLKKYIDYPMSWINKQIAPSNERKARKFEQKERGQIPTKREPEDFRQSIKTPTWFKAVQFGLIASVVGVMGLVDTKRTTDEEPEEPEEQKEE